MRASYVSRRAMLATIGGTAMAGACSPGTGGAQTTVPLIPNLELDLLSLVPVGEREAVRLAQSSWLADDLLDEAIEYLEKKRLFTRLQMTGGRLCFARAHVLNALWVDLDLQGQFDFTRLTQGTALSIHRDGFGDGAKAFDRHPVLRGLSLVGPGANTPTRGLVFEAPDGRSSQNISVSDFVIRNFGLATGHGQNGFLIDYAHGHIALCDIGFEAPGGVANGGERMAFSQICFAGNRVHLRSDNVNASIFVQQCSLDYPTGPDCRFVDANRGGIALTDCHIEGNNPGDRMGTVSAFRQGDSADAQLSIRGGRILFGDRFPNYVWENLNGSAPIVIDDVYMLRGGGKDGVLASGRIAARLTYLEGGGDHTNGHLLSRAENALVDGDFTRPTPIDLLRPSGQAGDALALAIVHGGGRAGRNALELRWKLGVPASAIFPIAIRSGELAGVDAGYRLTGTACSVRLVHAAARLADDGRIAVLRESQPILAAPLPAQPGWSPLTGGTRNVRAPAWATHALLVIDGTGPATLQLDQLTMTRIG